MLTDAQWMEGFQRRLRDERVPLSGTLELTSRCNLKCVHCYLGPQEEQWKKRALEMPTEKVLALIDEFAAAGTLFLLITGGDPMVHRDFKRVYRYACEKGLIVTVFCDGILVDEAVIALFRELPPQVVEVSLYGATPEVYEAVTRVPGSHAKAWRGINRLREGGVRFRLKTVIMTVNEHEVEAMRAQAAAAGVSFKTDNAIFPCLPNGDERPLALRVSPQVAVAHELAEPRRLQEWVDYVQSRPLPTSDYVYRCGAGVTSFHVDPFGNASPCLMTTHHKHSLDQRSFASLWQTELAQIRSLRPRAGYGCNDCEKQLVCASCPGFNYQENGADDVKSEYVCATTQERWQAIQLHLRKPAAAPVASLRALETR